MNSREHQLTPWSNDPVTDRPGQAFYLRDEETGDLWSPTALPIRDEAATYVARHGWGYSRFEHASHGIAAELLEFVPLADPIKISRLTLRNTFRPHQAAVGDRLCGMGPRRVTPGGGSAVRDHAHRSRQRRDAREQPLEPGFRRSRRLRRPRRAPDELDRRPARVHRPQRRARLAGGPGQRDAALGPGGLRPRSLRRPADHDRDRAERRRRDRLLPRRRRRTKPRRGR